MNKTPKPPFLWFVLRLHYVPGCHGSPVCPKRSAPWDFCHFSFHRQVSLRLVQFSHGTSRYPWRAVAGNRLLSPGGSKAHYGSERFGPRSTTDANTFRPVLMRFLTFLMFWSSSHTLLTFSHGFLRIKRGRREALEHACAHGMRRRPFKQ